MLSLLLGLTLAHAAPVGHYHPVDVGTASARFERAQSVAGTTFQRRQGEAEALAAGLVAYEEALDLLGDLAPADQRQRLAELRRQFDRDKAVVQAFAQDQLDGFDAAFSDALDRALAGRAAVVCRPTAERGLRMGPGAQRATPVTCEGTDLNAELATRMDADAALGRTLDALLSQTWPAFDLTGTPQAAIGDGTATLDPRTILRQGAPHALSAIDSADEDARLDIQAALEEGASEDDLRGLLDRSRAITQLTAGRRAQVAAPVLAALGAQAAKDAKKGGPTLAWCAQPVVLGGCTVPAVDDARQAAWLAQAKVRKALEAADAYRP